MNHSFKILRKRRRKRGLVLSVQGSLPASLDSEFATHPLPTSVWPLVTIPQKTERDLRDKGLYSTELSHSVTKEQEVNNSPKGLEKCSSLSAGSMARDIIRCSPEPLVAT